MGINLLSQPNWSRFNNSFQGVHGAQLIECGTLLVVALDEVGLLLLGQTQNGLVALSIGNLDGGGDEVIQRDDLLGDVVERHVVGVAVGNVGLCAGGQLSLQGNGLDMRKR